MAEGPQAQLEQENAKLRRELEVLQITREQEIKKYEENLAKSKESNVEATEVIEQRNSEMETMKNNLVKLTRQLDEEVSRRDQVQAESQMLERKVQDLTKGSPFAGPVTRGKAGGKDADDPLAKERGSQASAKLMRVVENWMRQKDLQQALLRGASINDQAFATLAMALQDCPSLQTLDLSQNLLTMDSCSDICQLITTAPSLSFISLADNLFSLRSVGYFMTAVMERQHTKKLTPLDLLDLQGNEGLVAAVVAPIPEGLLKQVKMALSRGPGTLPSKGAELIAQVMRALWRFLHDTSHPQVRDTSPDEVAFQVMDKVTVRKMENALMKILLLGADGDPNQDTARPVTANFAFIPLLEGEARQGGMGESKSAAVLPVAAEEQSSSLPRRGGAQSQTTLVRQQQVQQQRPARTQPSDPFADLKQAFEPPREKLKTFNLKQIVTRNGTVLMNMLERLLENTEIDARDVETDQTLLEYACQTGNLGLAKLCYRRGANLSAKTSKGDTAFNIVTKNRRFDLMEFLHTYGVKINSRNSQGRTALHTAVGDDNVDGICRLLEWGADVNIRDYKKRTPIHLAAAGGNVNATMLLLEFGADMNAKDDREYTAVAHAEANNHFALMDRLVQLGGKGHGLHQNKSNAPGGYRSHKGMGELNVSSGMLKSSSLGRIGKITVSGMPGPIEPGTR